LLIPTTEIELTTYALNSHLHHYLFPYITIVVPKTTVSCWR
jgi:hypothetical protein